MVGVDNGVTWEQFSPGRDYNNSFGNCLYQAFAWALFGNDDNWDTTVREPTRKWWDQVMADPNSQRRAMYSVLNAQTAGGPPSDGRSPGTFLERDNLQHQLHRNQLWGTMEVVQVLADAFQVEVLMHMPRVSRDGRPTEWEVLSRGIHGSLQIHLVNYVNYHHWTALRPDDGALQYNIHMFLPSESRKHVGFVDLTGRYNPARETSPLRPGENGEPATGSNAPLLPGSRAPLPADDEGFEGPTSDDPSDKSLVRAENEGSKSADGESEEDGSSLHSYEYYENLENGTSN